MGLTSLQVCMDSSDWFQGTVEEENGRMESSLSSPSEDILTCSRPLIERRLRPPHDQALNCPRCDSTHTKFCYYNNYSLSQPRYFCKSCRRYWTKGGTLRNIPVGGGCRKNKKVSSKKSSPNDNNNPGSSFSSFQHSFTDSHFSRLASFTHYQNPSIIMDPKYSNLMLENPVPIDFMESKYEALVGNGELGLNFHGSLANGFPFPGLCSSSSQFSMAAMDMNNGVFPMENYHQHQRLTFPYENQDNYQNNAMDNDVKPNPKLLSLECHDQACNSDAGKYHSIRYHQLGGLGSSWTGLMKGYGSAATNPLV